MIKKLIPLTMMTKKTQWKLDAKYDLSPIVKCVNVSEYMQAI